MPDVIDKWAEDKWAELTKLMQHLPPIRNINAIRAWLVVYRPDDLLRGGVKVIDMFDQLVRDAAQGIPVPKRIVLYMMMAFAAGRAYQEANPNAPRDPSGYGG